MKIKTAFIFVAMVTSLWLPGVRCHGRLIDPASRSSMWRYGFPNPPNYDDNQLYCGGVQRQWVKNNGKCGVCGDPYDGERENEAGGKYANGIIAATYQEGQTIYVKVEITANHLGWFEFRICPNSAASQSCLDRYLLNAPGQPSLTRFSIGSRQGIISTALQLPQGLTCSQCVIQWKYHAGNSWGYENGRGCLGCGAQEEFYGCADVTISTTTYEENYPPYDYSTTTKDSGNNGNNGQGNTGSHGNSGNNGNNGQGNTGSQGNSGNNGNNGNNGQNNGNNDNGNDDTVVCHGAGAYRDVPGMDSWCTKNCADNYCPETHCVCSQVQVAATDRPNILPPRGCNAYQATGSLYDSPFWNMYCQITCTPQTCPNQVCQCATDGRSRSLNCEATDPQYRTLSNIKMICNSICNFGDNCPPQCQCN